LADDDRYLFDPDQIISPPNYELATPFKQELSAKYRQQEFDRHEKKIKRLMKA
jgi:hypothetical protein